MERIYTCPECEIDFKGSETTRCIQNIDFNEYDNAIQAVILVYCPECENLVVAMFDSMECTQQFDA